MIYIEYVRAIQSAERLKQIASDIRSLSQNSMENTLANLRKAWQSDTSPAYCAKLMQVQGEIAELAGQLQKVAELMASTAEAMRKAEERSQDLAENRTY